MRDSATNEKRPPQKANVLPTSQTRPPSTADCSCWRKQTCSRSRWCACVSYMQYSKKNNVSEFVLGGRFVPLFLIHCVHKNTGRSSLVNIAPLFESSTYAKKFAYSPSSRKPADAGFFVLGGRFELPTSASSEQRSNQLSYPSSW